MTDQDRYRRVLDEARRLRTEGVAFIDAIGPLRALSASPIDSIKAGRDAYQIPIGEAKLLVHWSPIWSDCREVFDQLHVEAEAATDELAIRPPSNER